VILIPGIGRFFKVGPAGLDNAEALPSRCFHDHPAVNPGDAPGTEFFQPRNLGLDIVGFNIQVYAAGVIYPLNLYFQVSGRSFQARYF